MTDPLLDRIQSHLLADLAQTVTWFRSAMPAYYLANTSDAEQERHLEILHAARRAAARSNGSESALTLVDDAEAGKLMVVGIPGRHRLLDVINLVDGSRLAERPIHWVELHTASDHSLFLDSFSYGPGVAPVGFDLVAHKQAILAAACGEDDRCSRNAGRFLEAVDQGYLARSRVERVVRHLKAWSLLTAAEDVSVQVERGVEGTTSARLLLACGAAAPWPVLAHAARVLHRHRLSLARGYLDWVPAVEGTSRTLIASFYVTKAGGAADEALLAAAAADLAAIHRTVADDLLKLYLDGTYGLDQLEQLRALLAIANQIVGPDHPYLDLEEAGHQAFTDQVDLCRGLCQQLAGRFFPTTTEPQASWEKRQRDLSTRCRAVEPRSQAVALEAMLHVLGHIRLINAWRPGRLGIACKLDPAVLPEARFPHRPFGVFAFAGAHARGFHIRFRPSARGGLRLLIPRNAAQYARARDGLLKEVYDLAWAQQLKNKDIPEGGSKCIALVEHGAADLAVRQVVDSLIDLILPADKVPEVVGPHGTGHDAALIFLGPDENMTPERIAWVAARAQVRGVRHHATLMSSKPGAGINHKEFGVTSEGIFTWISAVLPVAGIANEAPYTVKITGGPDGDVGGNLLKILAREHRKRCQVVAIADGTGCAEDPAGLDWDELLRLVKEDQGIAGFDPAKLSKRGGRVLPATDKAGEDARNSLHNRIVADLFVPCGGRPATINDDNWQQFLAPGGRPSAKAMVEGANIFLSPGARQHLEDAGLIVIKDSSANKGGVICSSYEVLAGLVLSDDEFLSIKPRYVRDVIELIRSAAQSEAKALIAAWKRRAEHERLSDLSAQLSEEINRVSGLLEPVISGHLDDDSLKDTWRGHLEAHCPHVLIETGPDGRSLRERLHNRIPRPHKVAILAKRLASRMVYKEGLTWCRTYIAEERLWETLATYLAAEAQVQAVCFHLAGLNLPGGEELVRVIAAGAQRELVRRRLGQEF